MRTMKLYTYIYALLIMKIMVIMASQIGIMVINLKYVMNFQYLLIKYFTGQCQVNMMSLPSQ